MSTNSNFSEGVELKESIAFRKMIAPNTSDAEMRERIKNDGTLENVSIRFYQGQQKTLRVRLYVEHRGVRSLREPIVTFPVDGEQYLSGDDEYLKFDVVVPVAVDDNILVVASNVDNTNSMTLNVDMSIDYYGGKRRVI